MSIQVKIGPSELGVLIDHISSSVVLNWQHIYYSLHPHQCLIICLNQTESDILFSDVSQPLKNYMHSFMMPCMAMDAHWMGRQDYGCREMLMGLSKIRIYVSYRVLSNCCYYVYSLYFNTEKNRI